ncbi:single-stranded DNA-binding protein [Streptomyces griseocarneus]|uniref:single-stranded DNA-binding protein n=1 Tax=Streptomyces griseocarneus TaxID=51201 RepID=UPI00167C5528|nr:single-stranded DNA-binding protein [Streptomyces griseocarneus]MBZ6477517.1 single-stranded DNA-binding protein [Streptomyces griseocarneus]GHG82732.1 single-stranded DNA-binding protein [Streptomyces griseocarneus]
MPIGETTITLIGNLTADPELRHTADGTPWLSFNVASNSKNWDKNRAEWGEGKTLFLRCTAWRWLAQNAESSLSKGTRVIVTGALRQYDYTSADGIQRTGFGLDVEDIAVSLRYATATVHHTNGTGSQRPKAQPGTKSDSWAIPAPAGGDDQPPF